jgi:hypothetical protein
MLHWLMSLAGCTEHPPRWRSQCTGTPPGQPARQYDSSCIGHPVQVKREADATGSCVGAWTAVQLLLVHG